MCLNWSLQDEGTNSSLEKEEAPLSTHLCLMNWFAYKQMWWKCDSTADNGRISVTLERQYWTTCHRCCLFISSHSFNLSFVYNAWLHTLAYITTGTGGQIITLLALLCCNAKLFYFVQNRLEGKPGKDIIMSMWLYFTGSPKMNQCPLAGFVWTQTEKMIPTFKCSLASRVFLPELSLEQQW